MSYPLLVLDDPGKAPTVTVIRRLIAVPGAKSSLTNQGTSLAMSFLRQLRAGPGVNTASTNECTSLPVVNVVFRPRKRLDRSYRALAPSAVWMNPLYAMFFFSSLCRNWISVRTLSTGVHRRRRTGMSTSRFGFPRSSSCSNSTSLDFGQEVTALSVEDASDFARVNTDSWRGTSSVS
jgi:hypothetical protein